jgi:hypothetical protein
MGPVNPAFRISGLFDVAAGFPPNYQP